MDDRIDKAEHRLSEARDNLRRYGHSVERWDAVHDAKDALQNARRAWERAAERALKGNKS